MPYLIVSFIPERLDNGKMSRKFKDFPINLIVTLSGKNARNAKDAGRHWAYFLGLENSKKLTSAPLCVVR